MVCMLAWERIPTLVPTAVGKKVWISGALPFFYGFVMSESKCLCTVVLTTMYWYQASRYERMLSYKFTIAQLRSIEMKVVLPMTEQSVPDRVFNVSTYLHLVVSISTSISHDQKSEAIASRRRVGLSKYGVM